MSSKKKLFAIGMTIAVAVPVLIAGTYAWFTISSKPEVQNISMTLGTDGMISISDDGVNFKSTLNLGKIFNKNYTPLSPISTYDGAHWYRAKYYTDEDFDGKDKKEGTINGDFEEIDFSRKDIGSANTNYTGHCNVPRPEEPEYPVMPATYKYGHTKTRPEISFSDLNANDYQAHLERYKEELAAFKRVTGEEASEAYDRIMEAYHKIFNEYTKIMSENYYLYADVWMRADIDEECEVHLSVPELLPDGTYKSIDKRDDMFGSYVLYYYRDPKADGSESFQYKSFPHEESGGGAETAIRVGFMVDQEGVVNTISKEYTTAAQQNGKTLAVDSTLNPATFKIYEPNADRRSAYQLEVRSGNIAADYDAEKYAKEDRKEDAFLRDTYYVNVDGHTYTSDEYKNGNYLWTSPVKYSGGSWSLATKQDMLSRLLVQKNSYIDPGIYDKRRQADPSLGGGSFNPLVASKDGGIALKDGTGTTRYYSLNNRYINMGRFIQNNQSLLSSPVIPLTDGTKDLVATDRGADNAVLHLKPGEARRVRIFFWLEGQDPDCWNDIAEGSIIANMEFAIPSTFK